MCDRTGCQQTSSLPASDLPNADEEANILRVDTDSLDRILQFFWAARKLLAPVSHFIGFLHVDADTICMPAFHPIIGQENSP